MQKSKGASRLWRCRYKAERSVPIRFDPWPGVLPKALAGFGVLTRLFGFSAIGIARLGAEAGFAAVSARAGEAGVALSRDAFLGSRDRTGAAWVR